MSSMPEMNPAILQAPGTGSNLQDIHSPDKTEFASLVKNEYSKSTVDKAEKKESHPESVKNKDEGFTGDMPSCSDCKADIENTVHNAGMKNGDVETADIKSVKRDGEHTNEKAIDINAKADKPEAGNLISKKEAPAHLEIKGEGPKHIDTLHSENNAVDSTMPKNNKEAGALSSRLTSGNSDQFGRQNGTRDYSFEFAGDLHNAGKDSEANNVTALNTANSAFDGFRAIQSPSALHTVKMPGVQELLDNVVYVIKSNNKMGVSVEHEKLGKLNISLSMEKGMVNVHINTSDGAVREIIQNNIQHIIDSLNKDGVSVGEFSVALKDHGEKETNHFSLKNGHGGESTLETKKEYRHSGLINIFA